MYYFDWKLPIIPWYHLWYLQASDFVLQTCWSSAGPEEQERLNTDEKVTLQTYDLELMKYLQWNVDVLVRHLLPSHSDGSETKKKSGTLSYAFILLHITASPDLHAFSHICTRCRTPARENLIYENTRQKLIPRWHFQGYLEELLQHHTCSKL